MTRTLLVIVGLGALTSLVCFAIAHALGGPDWERTVWWGRHDRGPAIAADGPEVTRTLAWAGGDSLTVNVGATVDYTQGPETKVTVVGPKGAVDNLRLDGDSFGYDRRMTSRPNLRISVTAPAVEEFTLNGSQTLRIAGYDRPKLEVSIHGSGDVDAKGRTDSLELSIAGSGDANLGAVQVRKAEVNIAGSGDATVAPTESAEVNIAGSGDVTLATRPARLETHIVGSGKIVQPGPAAAAP